MSYVVLGISPNEEFLVASAMSEERYNVGFIPHEEVIKEGITSIITTKGTFSIGMHSASKGKLKDIMQVVLIMVKDLLAVYDNSVPLGSFVEDQYPDHLVVGINAVRLWEDYGSYCSQREEVLEVEGIDMSDLINSYDELSYVALDFIELPEDLSNAEREYLLKRLGENNGGEIDLSEAYK